MWKTRTKKLASMLLTLLMAVTLLSGTAFAAEETAANAKELMYAIADGNTITLTADINLGTDGITIPAGATVTLKLGGFSLTSTDDTISVEGTLIVEGEGSVTSTGKGKGALVNYPGGEVELKGGSYNAEEWYTLKNMGNMSIYSGVTVEAETDGSSLIANGWYGGNGDNDRDTEYCANEAILHIYGGHFSGGMNTVKNDDNGVLFIENGTFENTGGPTILNWNEAEISGGDFSSPSGPVLAYGYSENPVDGENVDKGEFVIKGGTFTSGNGGTAGLFGYGVGTKPGGKIQVLGGTFNGLLGVQSNYTAQVTISKGSFNSKVDSSLIESGKTSASLTSDGDTTFYIGSADEVAETMMAKAQKGDTITVLQGDLTLHDIASGITVANNGEGKVTVNNISVGNDGTWTTPEPVVDPDEGKEIGKVEVGGSSTDTDTDADTDKENPGTGDNSYVALAMAALLASGVCVVLSQKRKHA